MGRGSETQLQVGENSVTERFGGLSVGREYCGGYWVSAVTLEHIDSVLKFYNVRDST